MTIGLQIQADSGRSEDELYNLAIASGGRTHTVLNGPGLAARLLQAGKRVIYRRWASERTTRGVQSNGDNNANDTYDPVDFVNRAHAVAPAGAVLALGNEPWGNTPDAMDRIAAWTEAALKRCNELGRKGGIFSFPTGNPPEPNLWSRASNVLQLAKDGGHLLLTHEYFGADKSTDALSSKNRPWHIERYSLIPAGLPVPEIVVTELGLAYNMDAHKGYVGVLSDDAYADQLIAVQRVYATRGIDSTVFVLTNKGNANWDKFNIGERVIERIAGYNATEQAPPVVTPPAEPSAWYWYRPVRAPFSVTSPFGQRPTPEQNDGDKTELHDGTDYAGLTDWNAYAAREGKVVFAGWNDYGYGNLVTIDHGGGRESLYGHLESVAVAVGATVSAGQKIGVIGSTGRSTARHLHWGVRKDGLFYAPAPETRPHPLDAAPPPVVTPDPVTPEPELPPALLTLLTVDEIGQLATHHEAIAAIYRGVLARQ